MAKGSDLHKKLGMGGFTPTPAKDTFKIDTISKDAPKKEVKDDSVAGHKPDLGHNLHKGADKSKGGAGGAGGRPKV